MNDKSAIRIVSITHAVMIKNFICVCFLIRLPASVLIVPRLLFFCIV